jgi:hypothetical protein
MNLAFLSSKLSSCYISFNKAETENIKRIGKRTGKKGNKRIKNLHFIFNRFRRCVIGGSGGVSLVAPSIAA